MIKITDDIVHRFRKYIFRIRVTVQVDFYISFGYLHFL